MLSDRRTSRVLKRFLIWNAAVTLIFQTSEANQTSCNCCNNHAGVPGIPGRNGDRGSPGRDGRDGRDGLEGAKGPTGPRGQQGKPGNQGKAGPQGIAGPPGPRGAPGKTGSQGSPGQMPLINWKECSWKDINEGKDYGNIKDCVFTKKYNNTTLHVYWDGNLRIHACCKRWYFTFNGAECSGPMPIDGVVYMATGTNKNLHRHRHIEGHCQNIPKGTVRVGFWVGDCRGSKAADAYTGWNSYSRIFVEEMNGPQK